MVSCNIEKLESELNEVYNEFYSEDNEKITLSFCEKERFYYTVNCYDLHREYDYENVCGDELIKKRYIKRYAKLSLYLFLSEKTHKNLPWGALTGIRPTKLYYQNITDADYFFKGLMKVSDKKYEIVKKIAKAQADYYKPSDSSADFFVGIPMCPTRCQYCSFISAEISKVSVVNEYIEALCYEIEQSKKLCENIRSVYIGGGTPVSLPVPYLKKVLDAIGTVNTEYTVEAGRPDCITEEVLRLLKDYNVTRVCVNPQTFKDETLKLIGRNHDSRQVIEKYRLAKSFGFDVNMDLIAGLPLETYDDFCLSLQKAVSLAPDNITVHTLCLKKGSKLKELCSRLPEGEVEKMIDYAYETLTKAGYSPYYLYRQKYMAGNLENTGYALKGKECIYNIDVMEEISQNVACGANAVSKRIFCSGERIERYGSPKDLPTYIAKVENIVQKKQELFS